MTSVIGDVNLNPLFLLTSKSGFTLTIVSTRMIEAIRKSRAWIISFTLINIITYDSISIVSFVTFTRETAMCVKTCSIFVTAIFNGTFIDITALKSITAISYFAVTVVASIFVAADSIRITLVVTSCTFVNVNAFRTITLTIFSKTDANPGLHWQEYPRA